MAEQFGIGAAARLWQHHAAGFSRHDGCKVRECEAGLDRVDAYPEPRCVRPVGVEEIEHAFARRRLLWLGNRVLEIDQDDIGGGGTRLFHFSLAVAGRE